MVLKRGKKTVIVSLLVAFGMMLMAGSTWASHDCCGHSSDSRRTAGAGPEKSPSDGDCMNACCQGVTAISSLPGISFQIDPRWSVETTEEKGDSRFETDIFRPPLA
jgi:hypothetical protein